MKKKILYITITAALLLSGCTKEDGSVPDTGSSTSFESLTESIHDESTTPDNSSAPAPEKEVIGVFRDSDGNEWKTYKKITDNRYYDVVGYMGTNSRYVILRPNPIGNGYHLCDLETNEVKTVLNRNDLNTAAEKDGFRYDWISFDPQYTNEYIIIRRFPLNTEEPENGENVVFDFDLKQVDVLPHNYCIYTHDFKKMMDIKLAGNQFEADCLLYIQDPNGENRQKICDFPHNTVLKPGLIHNDENFIYGALADYNNQEMVSPCAVDIKTGERFIYNKRFEVDDTGIIYTSENYLLYSIRYYKPNVEASEPAYLVVFDKTKREFYEIGDTINSSEGRYAALTPDGTKTVTLAISYNREGDITERTMRIYDTAGGKLLKSIVPENGGTLCCTNEKIYVLGDKHNTIYTFEELGL